MRSLLYEIKRYEVMSKARQEAARIIAQVRDRGEPEKAFMRFVMANISTSSHGWDPLIPVDARNYDTLRDDLPTTATADDITTLGYSLVRICNDAFGALSFGLDQQFPHDNVRTFVEELTPGKVTLRCEYQSISTLKVISGRDYGFIVSKHAFETMKHEYTGNDLVRDALVCVLRYSVIDGGNHLSIPPLFYRHLRQQFGFDHELFASPLNRTLPKFCSLFRDTDAVFGSSGDVFSYPIRGGRYVANPPYIEKVMLRFALHLCKSLETTKENIYVLMVIPDWTSGDVHTYGNYESYNVIHESQWHRFTVALTRDQAPFFDHVSGTTHYPTKILVVGVGNHDIDGLEEVCQHGWAQYRTRSPKMKGGSSMTHLLSFEVPLISMGAVGFNVVVSDTPPVLDDSILDGYLKHEHDVRSTSQRTELGVPVSALYNFACDAVENSELVARDGVPVFKDPYKEGYIVDLYPRVTSSCMFNTSPLIDAYLAMERHISFIRVRSVAFIDLTPYNERHRDFVDDRVQCFKRMFLQLASRQSSRAEHRMRTVTVWNRGEWNSALHEAFSVVKKRVKIVVISGSFEYFRMKETYLLNDVLTLPIRFVQIYLMMLILKRGGSFIMYYYDLQHDLARRLLLFVRRYFEKLHICRAIHRNNTFYIVGTGFFGISPNQEQAMRKAIHEVLHAFPDLGENVIPSDPSMREMYRVNSERRGYSRFLSEFFTFTIPKDVDLYMSFVYDKLKQEHWKVMRKVRKMDGWNEERCWRMHKKHVKNSLYFCQRYGIEIHPAYRKLSEYFIFSNYKKKNL